MAEHKQNDQCLSYINISLQELNTFDEYEGDDLPARFRAFCLDERGQVEVIADYTAQVAGQPSYIRTVQSPGGTFYYFGLLPVNSESCFLFIGDCDGGSKELYEPLFNVIWESLTYFNKPAKAYPVSFPADGSAFWQISHHLFKLSGEPQCYISDGDGALYVKIEALAPHRLTNKENDLITSYD